MKYLAMIAFLACFALACDDESNPCEQLTPCLEDRSCRNESDEYFCWWFGRKDDNSYYCCASYEQACQHACDVDECAYYFSMPPQPGCQ